MKTQTTQTTRATVTNIIVASIILEQLGGQRFLAMTGAKNLLDTGVGLQFSLPDRFAKDGINRVRISLMPSDTYLLTFCRVRGTSFKLVAQVEGVYADVLREVFTRYTGLDTHL